VVAGAVTSPLRLVQAWVGKGDELILVARNPSGV
jgi:hypothetical protein